MLKRMLVLLMVVLLVCTGSRLMAEEVSKGKPFLDSGDKHLKAGRFPQAIADYNQAIALDPGLALAYNNRGLAKYKSRDEQGALSDFDKAIELNPENMDFFFNRGLAKKALSDFQGAISDFSSVIAQNQEDKEAYYMRGLSKTYIEGIEKEDYCADFEKAKELGHPAAQGAIQRYCIEED